MSNLKYKLRQSPRSKWVRLVMSAIEGLLVVVPRGYDFDKIPQIISQKQKWIEKQNKKFKRYKNFALTKDQSLPVAINLFVLGEMWEVKYLSQKSPSVRAKADTQSKQLLLVGKIESKKACRKALKNWLSKKAKEYFVQRTLQIAERHEFTVNKITIRCQKGRWGSCSSKKNISINLKLLFFPPETADYVLIHELCHTVHLNHSSKFWGLVESTLPNYRLLHQEAKQGAKFVAGWLYCI